MSLSPARRGRTVIFLWLAFLLACGAVIARSQFTADLSAFLPRSPTPAQQLLLDQLRDGLASRLILAGIEGADAATRAKLSRHIAHQLRGHPAFGTVNNGEPVSVERDRAYLFNNRYLLSPAVTAERFSVEGMRAAIGESIDMLASPAGMFTRSLLPRDPTGETMQLLGIINSATRPKVIDGVWTSRDETRALLLLQTRAPGSDTDAQQHAMNALRQAFDAAASALPSAASARLVMTGPGVFSVASREAIRDQVSRLSVIGFALIAAMLLLVYRSVTALALGFLPVLSGALAGIATVSLGFGAVHGITMGFGTALIGEAVDYSIYLFVQSEQGSAADQHWIRQFWPTIRLGVLTSIFGFASMLLSGFPGLAQLGLYSIAGLITAAAVTRYVLPQLLPVRFHIHDVSTMGRQLQHLSRHASTLRWPAALILVSACAVLFAHRGHLWDDKLSSLSPVSRADAALDARLRADLGAPDVRYLVVVSGGNRESVLQSAEQASTILQALAGQGVLAGFDSPARYLPSAATQRARQSSLPAPPELESRLAQAVDGLPLRAGVLAPFLADAAKARTRPLIEPADLAQTSMAMAVDALLIARGQTWNALLPLNTPAGGEIDATKIRAALNAANTPNVLFVDMKAESDRLYSDYLHEAIMLSLGGLACIIGLLLFAMRSPLRVARVCLPLAAAILSVAAVLALCGLQLTILHLIGLLLVAAVGSNYALFFDQAGRAASLSPRTLASMAFANLTTVAGFGVLAFSNVSVLQAMGVTVAPGVVLALLFAAIFAGRHE